MAEASFAQTFLTTLDSRPIKLSADHVEDAKTYPARPPYILPRMPKPMSKPTTLIPGQQPSLKVTLKSLRNPPLDITLTSQPPTTSILDIKSHVSAKTNIPLDKLKILHSKKPVPDSKVLSDLTTADVSSSRQVDFTVMVIGGAATAAAAAAAAATVTATATATDEDPAEPEPIVGVAALETERFWTDLHGFLSQRLKDETKAAELSALFKGSWESSRSNP